MRKKHSFGTGKRIKGSKERGEWAELCFMARAAGEGIRVSKPYGETSSYDVGAQADRRIQKVQVKSTIYCRRGKEYSLNVLGPKRKRYPKGAVDFFAVYVIPLDEWYIIPYEAMGNRLTLHFTPGSRRARWEEYREAWHLLRQEPGDGTIFACADEGESEVVLVGSELRRLRGPIPGYAGVRRGASYVSLGV
jgi:hypothetical protein